MGPRTRARRMTSAAPPCASCNGSTTSRRCRITSASKRVPPSSGRLAAWMTAASTSAATRWCCSAAVPCTRPTSLGCPTRVARRARATATGRHEAPPSAISRRACTSSCRAGTRTTSAASTMETPRTQRGWRTATSWTVRWRPFTLAAATHRQARAAALAHGLAPTSRMASTRAAPRTRRSRRCCRSTSASRCSRAAPTTTTRCCRATRRSPTRSRSCTTALARPPTR